MQWCYVRISDLVYWEHLLIEPAPSPEADGRSLVATFKAHLLQAPPATTFVLPNVASNAGPPPDLEFNQMERLTAEAGHDRLLHDAGVDAEPIPELEFDQTLGW